MLFFSTDSSQNLKSRKVNCAVIIICYVCKTKFSSTIKNLLFFIKNTKKKQHILQQVTRGNTPVLILKRMVGQKIPPLKKILVFQDLQKGYELLQKRKFQTKS